MMFVLLLLLPSIVLTSTFNPTDYRNHPMWQVCGTDPAERRPWYESVERHFPAADRYIAKLIEVTRKAQARNEHHTFQELVAIAHKELHADLETVPDRNFMGAVVWKSPAFQRQLSRLAWCVLAQDANRSNPGFYQQDLVTDPNKIIGLLESVLPSCVPARALRAANWYCFHVPNQAIAQRAAAKYQEQQTQVVSAKPPCLPTEIARCIAKYAIPYGLSVEEALAIEGVNPPSNNLASLDLVCLKGLSQYRRDPEDSSFSFVNNRLIELDPAELASLGGIKTLILDRNNLGTLTADTFTGVELTSLCIRHNYLRTIAPHTFPRSLTRLDLSYNQLRELPGKPFAHLSTLITLILSHNHLTTLGDALTGLESLYSLQVDHNRLQDVPRGTMAIPTLKLLSLAHNKLEHVPSDLAGISSLNLTGNPIPEAEKEILRKTWHGTQQALQLEPADEDPSRHYTKEELDQA
jgi:hypothetical protein